MDQAEDNVTIDMDAAVNEISESLVGELDSGLVDDDQSGSAASPPSADTTKPPITEKSQGAPSDTKDPAAVLGPKAAPKSWKTEMHAEWAKMTPAQQAYVEQREEEAYKGVSAAQGEAKVFKDVLAPFQASLQSRGHNDPVHVIRTVMTLENKLAHGTPEVKLQTIRELAKGYGVDLGAAAAPADETYRDPALTAVQNELNEIKGKLTAEEQGRLNRQTEQISKEIEAFATDPAHAYFNEVQLDIVTLLRGDPKMSLQDAYDRALWANPITRAKEQARLTTEAEAKIRKEAEEAAIAARKAKGTVVRGKESERVPTDPLGSIDDTMRETMRAIKARG